MEEVVQEHTPGNGLISHCDPNNDISEISVFSHEQFSRTAMLVSSISCRSSEGHCPIKEHVPINITLVF